MLQKELELKTALFDKAQETIRDLTEEKVCWAAALGMRDWRPGALRTRLARPGEIKLWLIMLMIRMMQMSPIILMHLISLMLLIILS